VQDFENGNSNINNKNNELRAVAVRRFIPLRRIRRFTFEDLVQAWLELPAHQAQQRERARLRAHAERHLVALHEQLLAGEWRPGRSFCFVVTQPKCREVWAAPFRDRIVHHLLYARSRRASWPASCTRRRRAFPARARCSPRSSSSTTCARITQNWKRPAWYLKCDLANFFVAIDKHVLWAELEPKIHEPFWRDLARTVLFHDPRLDYELRCPPACCSACRRTSGC
jgi:RNA-directed DNA polymerase